MRGRHGAVACVAAVSVTLVCASAQAGQSLRAGFAQQGPKLSATDEQKSAALGFVGGQFGHSVALSADGKRALVGGNNDRSGYGSAWVFGSFGQSISLSSRGEVLLVGASTGGAWLFDRSGSSWKQSARLSAPVAEGSLFGNSVALSASGTTAVVGAPYDGTGSTKGSGTAWAFVGLSGDGKTAIASGPADANAGGAAWVSTT